MGKLKTTFPTFSIQQINRQSSYFVTIILSFLVLSVYITANVHYPIFPKYVDFFGGGPSELGFLTSIYFLMMFVFSSPSGWLADKLGKKHFLLFSLFGVGLSHFLYTQVSSLAFLYLARGIGGIFVAGIFPVSVSFLSDYVEENKRSFYIGVLSSAISIGCTIGPLVGGVLMDLVDIVTPFYFCAILAFITLVLVLVFLPKSADAAPKASSLEGVLQSVQSTKFSYLQTTALIDSKHISFASFILISSLAFSNYFTWTFTEPGLSFFIYDVIKINSTMFGLYIAVYGTVAGITQSVSGYLAMKKQKKPFMVVAMAIYSISFLFIMISSTYSSLILLSVFAGLGWGIFSPVANSEIANMAPKESRSFWLGVYNSSLGIAGFLGPLIGGMFYSLFGSTNTFGFSMGFSLIVVGIFILFYRQSTTPFTE
ncbi:MAG: MFS transporter [Candidatus Hermodarchaeota archaeon]